MATPADAADLASEVLTVAWRRAADLPAADADATGWLFGIARGVLFNHHRANRRRSALVDRLAAHLAASGDAVPAESSDAVVAVRSALGRLSPHDRELLTLWAWDGLSADQIAVVMDITPAAVRQRLVRARRRLRAELEREAVDGLGTLAGSTMREH